METTKSSGPRRRGSLTSLSAALHARAAALNRTKTREKADGAAIFLGTVPLLTDGFVFSDRYSVEVHDSTNAQPLSYTYHTKHIEKVG